MISWNQIAIKYIPVLAWTMADKGSKQVEIVGADDKRQISSVFAITPLGDFLIPQLIREGTNTICLSSVHFLHGFDVLVKQVHKGALLI